MIFRSMVSESAVPDPRGTLAASPVQGAEEATSAALRGHLSGSSGLLHTSTLIDCQTQLEGVKQA